MKITGRLGSLVMAGALVAAVLSGTPAHADTSEAFAGTATARALNLEALSIKVTAGSTTVLANSTPKAHADGAGLALLANTVSSADADGPNQTQAPAPACGVNLPVAGILNVALACSKSAVATTNGAPTANATSNVGTVGLGLLALVTQLLDPILAALAPLVGTIDGLLSTVTNVVAPLLGGLGLGTLLTNLGVNPAAPVASLIDALKRATGLANISIGDSASNVVTTAGGVIASSSAKGATITVLPGFTITGGPLLTITVGAAATSATFDRRAGTSAATFDPALVTVNLLGTVLSVAPGLSSPLPGILDLEVGSGRTIKNPDGTVGAVASGVGVRLLGGAVVLELAHAESAVGGARATITAKKIATAPAAAPQLAKTGSEAPWLPLGVLLILAAYLTRRAAVARR